MNNHNIIYKNNGDLWGYGRNSEGQLGIGTCDNVHTPMILYNDKDIKDIICGGFHTIIYRYNGDVLVCGYNFHGQLGLSTNDTYIINRILLMNDKEIKIIAAGLYHTIIYKNNGDLLVCGDNKFGQLGLGTLKKSQTFVKLLNDKTIKIIVCGGEYTIIYKKDGNMFVFGRNEFGQLGLGDNNDRCTPTLLLNDNTIQNIFCGETFTIFYKNNGDIYGFGDNIHGQLKNDDNDIVNVPMLLDIKYIDVENFVCGGYHIITQKNNGDIFVSGSNQDAQLGYESNYKKNTNQYLRNDKDIKFIICGEFSTIMYKKNGEFIFIGEIRFGTCFTWGSHNDISKGNDIISINNNKINLNFVPCDFDFYSNIIKKNIMMFLLICKNNKYNHNIIVPKYIKIMICCHIFLLS